MPASYPFLDLARLNAPYADRLKEAAARVIDSGRFLHGPETHAFERELAAYLGAGEAIGVSNGLDALRLIFRSYMELGRLRPGDEIIFPANTYIASILPLTELGLTAVPSPASETDMNLDLNALEPLITPRTRGVLLVHLYGTPCWDAAICRRLHDRGLLLIEDNAQAIGARAGSPGLNGSDLTGALGDAAAISFYPTKNLGALGDGGAVVTSDPALASTVRALANYGSDRRYHNIYRGYNNRLDEIQAAFLRVKLEDLDEESRRRAEAAEAYSGAISTPWVQTPGIFPGCRQVWHQYVVRSSRRDALREYLECHGISTDIHYAVPPHLQPCYEGAFSGSALIPTAEMAATLLSLPIAAITPDDARHIASVINSFPG